MFLDFNKKLCTCLFQIVISMNVDRNNQAIHQQNFHEEILACKATTAVSLISTII